MRPAVAGKIQGNSIGPPHATINAITCSTQMIPSRDKTACVAARFFSSFLRGVSLTGLMFPGTAGTSNFVFVEKTHCPASRKKKKKKEKEW